MKRRFSSSAGSTTIITSPTDGHTSAESDSGQHTLRLSKRLKQPTLSEARKLSKDLSDSRSTREVLSILLKFWKQLPLESVEETEFAAKVIVERANKEEDVANKVKLFSILGVLLRYPGVNLRYIVEEAIRCITKEESHNVVTEILSTLGIVGKFLPSEVELHARIIDLAKEHLQNSNHLVRCRCLSIIATMDTEQNLSDGNKQIQSLGTLQQFTSDQDPRVRTAALEALLILHERNIKLAPDVYGSACEALHDDYEEVRLKAVKLLWVISQLYPERPILSTSTDERRCIDDAFVRICQMVNDLSMKVRAQAAGLLGSLHLVSPRYLQQTLDKKVMSHLKRKKTDHEQQRELHAAGLKGSAKWATRTTNHVPSSELNPEEVSLIDSGACGAFVYGLEDELLEVRSAAVDSLCELADQHPDFARLSLDFLVDMFNDEIESVRLNAIHSLGKISRHVILREDQLETILGVLEDFSGEIRDAVRELLSHCQLSTRACLHAAIYALLGNLTKYPQDKKSIWNCLKHLGNQHQNLAVALVPELLSTHPFFATSEPDVDDPAYVGMVVIVLNAALNSPTIVPILPSHTRRHYPYLRDQYPELLPEISLDDTLKHTWAAREYAYPVGQHVDSKLPDTFLAKTLSIAVKALSNSDKNLQKASLRNVANDLEHLAKVKSRFSATANCALLYLKTQICILDVQTDQFWDSPSILCCNCGSLTPELVEELVVLSYKMDTLFVGLDSEQREMIREIRLVAHSLLIIYLHRNSSKALQSNSVAVSVWEQLLARIRSQNKLHCPSERNQESFIRTLSLFQEFVECNITKPSVIVDHLQSLVGSYQLRPLVLENQLRRASAVMNEPQGGCDNPIRFTAGLTLGVDVDADITNVVCTSQVFIQVVFPDFTRQLFKPKPADFRHLSKMKHRLITKVIFSHSAWSDPCYVDVSLVLKCAQDINEQEVADFITSVLSSTSAEKSDAKIVKQVKNSADNLQDGYVELCSPVQIYVLPKSSGH
ncbi:integrator complex subunit 4-like isoform X2 [Dendronephthya gigantea]|uniref:integrator complex subunit 4-like isoform X2 n=1 Tax=Dendronephthya gigantea TaxID=151771 RepID=UPI00106AB111|nr:integrator complex subunit 4-like isoform X2 [Dendronephthya gigantea]